MEDTKVEKVGYEMEQNFPVQDYCNKYKNKRYRVQFIFNIQHNKILQARIEKISLDDHEAVLNLFWLHFLPDEPVTR